VKASIANGIAKMSEPEGDQHELGQHVEGRHERSDRVHRRAADEPDRAHRDDHADADDDVPGVAVERTDLQGACQVVRHEERRERDHDQVVEEEHPARHEAGQVVVGPPNEGRGPARLRERRGRLRVRQRDDEEQKPDAEEHERREADGVERDDPEREVDRGGDLAVGDREERAGVELAPQAWQLPCH
jgi:hypothetical protein